MLSILPLTRQLIPYWDQADGRYLAGETVSLKISRLGFSLEYTPHNRAQWQVWRPDALFTPQELAERQDVACFLAFQDGRLAGQAQVMHHFDRMAMLFDIRVEVGLRRSGVGTELVAACRDWARRQGLGGLVAETRDANPGACQFFEKCGFRLGGVDRLRYSALPDQMSRPPAMRDCALTFYQLF